MLFDFVLSMQGLKTELEPEKVKTILEAIRQESKYFKHFSSEDIKELSELLKTLKMFRGDNLLKIGETIT